MTGPKPGGGSDTPWAERGACVGHPEPDLWHPVPGGITKAKAQQIRDAKTICAGCDVRAECLADALANGREGIWGGLTDGERARIAPKPRKVAQVPECGTRSGYGRHQKRKERACEPCVAANRAYAKAHYHASDHRRRNLA